MPALVKNISGEDICVMCAGNDEHFPAGEKRIISDGVLHVIAREHPEAFEIRPVSEKAISAALRGKAEQDSEELERVSKENEDLKLRVAELEAERDGRTFTREPIPEGLVETAKKEEKKKGK